LSRGVAWIAETLGWGETDRVLDLACGYGRHLEHLCRLPGRPVGLDLVAEQLAEARHRLAAALPPLVQADMNCLPFADGSFEVLIQLFNSFGYRATAGERDPAPERRLLREMRRVLARGGQMLLELPSIEHVRAALDESPTMVLQTGRRSITENWRLDAATQMLEGTTTFHDRGASVTVGFFVRLFPLTEFIALARSAELRPRLVFGDLDGSPFRGINSHQMVVILERDQ
jgi:SAM-dependent methyltransferase